MLLMRLRVIALLLVVAVVTGVRVPSTPNRPWPPGLQSVKGPTVAGSRGADVFMPPGYLELVASEPMIEEPILIDWDRMAACGSSKCAAT
jgi:hypothetical protein